jgi:hypothetical protein
LEYHPPLPRLRNYGSKSKEQKERKKNKNKMKALPFVAVKNEILDSATWIDTYGFISRYRATNKQILCFSFPSRLGDVLETRIDDKTMREP